MFSLDRIDKVILNTLQNNGRMTNVEIAGIAGISAPPCLRRIKILNEKGIIQGYHTRLCPEKLGYSLKTMCVVSLHSQCSRAVMSFIEHVSNIRNVRFCFSTPGSETFILIIFSKNLEEYELLLQNKIQNHSDVSEVKTYLLHNTHKEQHGIPIDI